ncbi:MAG: PrsW family intramembrane metalloprotease [Treponema sp.]|nr:PrsW family intramembrane metalloprotease [Treponema sp.]
MNLILPIALCFIPVVICFFIFTFCFKLKILHQLVALVLALICVLPISVVQYFLGMVPFFHSNKLILILVKSILLYGLVEEGMKFGFCNVLPSKNLSLRNFLFLSFFMGMSLGCFESVIYFLDNIQKVSGGIGESEIIYPVLFTRMITADLIHAACAGLLGIFIFEAREKNYHILLLIMPVVIHGVYDFFACWNSWLKFFSIAVMLYALIECRVRYSMYNIEEK